MNLYQAYRAVADLEKKLKHIVERDQEQEVRGMALPVIDAVVGAARQHVRERHPVLESLHDVISVETISSGEPIRAVDAWVVVGQLLVALERGKPPTVAGF